MACVCSSCAGVGDAGWAWHAEECFGVYLLCEQNPWSKERMRLLLEQGDGGTAGAAVVGSCAVSWLFMYLQHTFLIGECTAWDIG